MNRNSNKLQVKDLVTIGIFSAIYFVINLIVMVCGGITPLLWIFMPPILSVLCGVIYIQKSAVCDFGIIYRLGKHLPVSFSRYGYLDKRQLIA